MGKEEDGSEMVTYQCKSDPVGLPWRYVFS